MSEIANMILCNGTVDLTNGSSGVTFKVDRAGDLILGECFVELLTGVVGTTTAPIVGISIAGAEQGSVTAPNARPAGDLLRFAPTTQRGPAIRLSAGETVRVFTKTAAAGGVPAGSLRVFLALK